MAFNAFSENTVVLHDGSGGAIVCDPGMSTPQEWDRFDRELAGRGWVPRAVLLTHAHLDHVLGCAGLYDRYGLRPRVHGEDRITYAMAPRAAELYGVPMDPLPELDPEPLVDGSELVFGDLRLTVKWTPGHAPGHVVLVEEDGVNVEEEEEEDAALLSDDSGIHEVASSCGSGDTEADDSDGDSDGLDTSLHSLNLTTMFREDHQEHKPLDPEFKFTFHSVDIGANELEASFINIESHIQDFFSSSLSIQRNPISSPPTTFYGLLNKLSYFYCM